HPRTRPRAGIEHLHGLRCDLDEEGLIASHLAEERRQRTTALGREVGEQLREDLVEERAVQAEQAVHARDDGAELDQGGDGAMAASDSSCSSLWPSRLVKKAASGVPWCGVATVTAVRTWRA